MNKEEKKQKYGELTFETIAEAREKLTELSKKGTISFNVAYCLHAALNSLED